MSSDLRLPDSPRGTNKSGQATCAPTPAPRSSATGHQQQHEIRTSRLLARQGQGQGQGSQPAIPGQGHQVRLDPQNGIRNSISSISASNSPPGPPSHHTNLYNNKSPSSQQGSSNPHHLPESPPDSGSEPPFSPPHDPQVKLSGAVAGSSSHSQQASPEMMPQPGHDGQMKHFVPYMHAPQHVKHLAHQSEMNMNLNLNINTQQHHAPHPPHPPHHSVSLPVFTQMQSFANSVRLFHYNFSSKT